MLQYSSLVDAMAADNHLKNSAVASRATLNNKVRMKNITSVKNIILKYMVVFVICLGCFWVNDVSALDLERTDASNNAVFTEREDSIVLMKNSVIVLDTYGFPARRVQNTILNRLEGELKKLGFTNVSRKAGGNEATANFILVVHPNDPINWAFRIRDTALDKEVFVDRLAHVVTVNHTIGKFINKFKPCILSDDALVLQR